MRGSRSARRSARSEEGARSVPRERSVLRRAPSTLHLAKCTRTDAMRLPDEQAAAFEACDDEICAGAARQRTLASVAVQVRLFQDDDEPGRLNEIVITFFPDGGGRFTGRVAIEDGDISAAARGAIAAAQTARESGTTELPSLRVRGTPEGASVRVDGDVVGVIPHTMEIGPGEHQLEVRAEGHEPELRTLRITAGGGHHEELVELERITTPTGGDDTAMHIIGASIIGAAGLALLVTGIASFAAGSCVEALTEGGCATGNPTDEVAAIGLTVAGSIAIAGAAVWLAIGLSAGSSGGGGQVEAWLGPRGAVLRGRF